MKKSKLIKESLGEFLKEEIGVRLPQWGGEDDEEEFDDGTPSEYDFAVIGLDASDTELQDLAGGEEGYSHPHDVEWFSTEQEANEFYEESNISNRYLVKILKSDLYI